LVRIEALTAKEIEQVHDAALQTLAEVGMLVPAASALAARLRKAGLEITGDDRLLLPRAEVEAAIECAPRVVRLGTRNPSRRIVLDGSRTYVATDGCGSNAIDLETGRIRPAVLADVAASARLTDALDEYDVYWMMVSAHDVPRASRVAREYLAALQNTTKHVQMIDASRASEARLLVRMAHELLDAGVMEESPVSMLISVVSPLRFEPDSTEAALEFAAAGLPVVACSMPIAGVTAPATPQGMILMAHTEILGFTTLIQTLHPGSPVIYCAFPAFADPRTGTTNYSDPRIFWAAAAAAQMGRTLDQPCFTSCDRSSLTVRPDMVDGGGLLDVSTLLSFEQLVLDHESLRQTRAAAAPQALTPETLALDVIRDVGPGGQFLAHKHTIGHIREFTTQRFVEREHPGGQDDSAARDPDAWEQAGNEARRLLDSHRVEPLPRRVEASLDHVIESAAA
jgi:trimethylamine--corrinoid protein Co-methyltransferase